LFDTLLARIRFVALPFALVGVGCPADPGDDTDDTSDTDSGDTSDTDSGDTDDTDDTGLDTGFGWDPLYLYPAGPGCDSTLDNQRGIVPKADGAWAAGRFPADSVAPMTVYQVRVVLRHGTDSQGVQCDASGAFDLRLLITDTALTPDGVATADRTKSFAAETLGAVTKRDLVYTLETPLVVPASDNLWVAVDGAAPGAGTPSCWQVCRQGADVESNQNFFTTESDPVQWTWSPLGDYGITDDSKMEFMMTVWYLD